MTAGAFTWLLAVPTLLTMLIAGAWHGAGYQFIVFGLIHGVYLVVNHAWRALTKVRRTQRREVNGSVWGTAFARSLTLIAVLISMAFFRSPSLSSAFRYVGALSGMNGFFGTVTAWNFNALNGFSHLGLREKFSILDDTKIIFVLPALFLISQLLPNTQQILREPLETAVGPLVKHAGETSGMDLTKASSYSWPSLNWRPSVPWAVALGLLAWLSVTHLVAPGEFLYFRF